MQTGKGVKVEKAVKALAKAGGLVDGESVLFFAKCNQFRPMIDAIVVTNARIMGLSLMEGYKYKALVTQVTAVQYDQNKGTVEVATSDGQVMMFKRIHSDDVPAIAHFLEYGRSQPAPEQVTDALTQLGAAGSSVLAKAGAGLEDYEAAKLAHKLELKEQRAQERAAQQAAKAAEQAAKAAEAGELMESARFAGKTVKIYKKGFVRVEGTFFKDVPYERLLSIEASADVGKKSGLGRTAAFVATGGLNMLGSNKRGDVYLTIVTERETHLLHEDPPTAAGIRASKKLAAAGATVLQLVASEVAGSDGIDQTRPTDSAGATPAERLRELKTMRDEGLVSEEEFEQLRTKLLDAL